MKFILLILIKQKVVIIWFVGVDIIFAGNVEYIGVMDTDATKGGIPLKNPPLMDMYKYGG